LLLVHLKLGLAVLLVIVVDFVLFKFLFLKPLLALLLGFVKDRLHWSFGALALKIELFNEEFLELRAGVGWGEETIIGNESKQEYELVEQENRFPGLRFAGCGEGVLVLIVDVMEHVLLVIGVFFSGDGWNSLPDESAEIFDT
jgi:hypothetical protein